MNAAAGALLEMAVPRAPEAPPPSALVPSDLTERLPREIVRVACDVLPLYISRDGQRSERVVDMIEAIRLAGWALSKRNEALMARAAAELGRF